MFIIFQGADSGKLILFSPLPSFHNNSGLFKTEFFNVKIYFIFYFSIPVLLYKSLLLFLNYKNRSNACKYSLPTIGTLFLSQTISAAGLAFHTLQVTSTRSFSLRSRRAPSPWPTSSILVGGTEINNTC